MENFTDRQKEIIEKAIEIITENGFKSLTIKNIAARMGFSEPAVYRHFKDKREILFSIVKYVQSNMFKIVKTVDTSLSCEDYFTFLICEITSYLKSVKGITILIMSEFAVENDEVLRDSMYSFYSKMIDFISLVVSDMKKRGEIRADVVPEVAAQVFIGIIQSMVLKHFLSGKAFDIDEKCKEIVSIFIKGVV